MAEPEAPTEPPPGRTKAFRSSLAWARSVAGPALIAAAVVLLLRRFAFGGVLTAQHPDVLQAWLPYHCLLGKSLAAGHVPAWNPYALGGAPFAADPQSGWMYVPAMALYGQLPCHVAAGWFIVLQPILAGLGMWWFLRVEGLSRPAATTAGLVLALLMSGSTLAIELPFAGTLAWTALMLGCAARCLRAGGWPGRLAWLAPAAGCWGQVAAAHLSDGLAVASAALLVYLAVRLAADVRTDRRTLAQAVSLVALLAVALPAVNLAVLLPRLAYLPRTSLGQGYQHLAALQAGFLGKPPPGPYRAASTPFLGEAAWPLGLMVSPGSYLGAAAGALSLAGLWSRRHRALAVSAAVLGVLTYLLSLKSLASALAPHLASLPFADFYQHAPLRFRYGTVLAVVILAGVGVDAWLEPRPPHLRALMLLPGVVAFWVLPVPLGVLDRVPPLMVLGMVAGAAAIGLSAWRPAFGVLIPTVLAVELVASGALGARDRPPGGAAAFAPLRHPTVPAPAYVRPGLLAATIRASGFRYLTWVRAGLNVRERGELARDPANWPGLADQRSMLFSVEDVDGYNPNQELRFWSLVRALQPRELPYNVSDLTSLPPVALDLLDVGWIDARAGVPPPLGGVAAGPQDGGWRLYRVPAAPPRAQAFPAWWVVGGSAAALAAVSAPGFDPDRVAVVEGGPAPPPARTATAPAGSARYRPLGTQAAEVDVDVAVRSLVLVRNVFDPYWHATVDGRPAQVLAADGVDQGVVVPPGRHRIDLAYDDPSIGYGLAGSAVSVAIVLGAALLAERKRRSVPSASA